MEVRAGSVPPAAERPRCGGAGQAAAEACASAAALRTGYRTAWTLPPERVAVSSCGRTGVHAETAHILQAEGSTSSPTTSHSVWSDSKWSPACRGRRSPAVSEPIPSPYDVGDSTGYGPTWLIRSPSLNWPTPWAWAISSPTGASSSYSRHDVPSPAGNAHRAKRVLRPSASTRCKVPGMRQARSMMRRLPRGETRTPKRVKGGVMLGHRAEQKCTSPVVTAQRLCPR